MRTQEQLDAYFAYEAKLEEQAKRTLPAEKPHKLMLNSREVDAILIENERLEAHAAQLAEALRVVMASNRAGDSRLAPSTFYIAREALANWEAK